MKYEDHLEIEKSKLKHPSHYGHYQGKLNVHSDYKGYYEERLQETLQEYHSKLNNSMNCPDIGSEKLEEYAREYTSIEKKLNEIPEDKESLRKILRCRQQQLLEKVSILSEEKDYE